jgi:hypothetical protein
MRWRAAREAIDAPSGRRRRASTFCASVSFGGRPHMLPALLRPDASFGRAGADKVALHVGEAAKRRDSSAGPYWWPVSAHGSASERSTICLTMANRSKVERVKRSMRVTITPSPARICSASH